MISAYIDRFETDKAVLLLGDDMIKVNFPRNYLPTDAQEGDYLNIAISRDEEATEAAEEEAMDLLKGTED